MRLTFSLFKKRNVMPGFKWTGKHRLTHKIYPHNIEAFTKRLRVEEKNLFFLRHPYLTVDQEHGHSAAVNRHEDWLQQKKVRMHVEKVKLSYSAEEQLGHLNVSTSWER